jgi:DNA-binding IclR family transcriptional regulator
MVASVKSAKRVIEIFEYFADRRAPATLMEIKRGLGYPISSMSALLRSLQQLGYLDYDRVDRTFVPTLRTALLGIWVNDMLLRDSTILRMMHELRDRTDGTVVLGAQTGLNVQYIHVVPALSYRGPLENGCVRPLLASAMGHVLLTLKSEAEVLALARRLNAEESNSARRVRPADLLASLERCRQDGYAYTEGATTPGGGIVAMLLAAPPHQLPMALGLGAPLSRLREQKANFIAALRELVEQHRRTMEREWWDRSDRSMGRPPSIASAALS